MLIVLRWAISAPWGSCLVSNQVKLYQVASHFVIQSDESYRDKVKMEKDLARVQNIMEGLNQQGAQLSEIMKKLRRSSSGAAMEHIFQDDGERKFGDIYPPLWTMKGILPCTFWSVVMSVYSNLCYLWIENAKPHRLKTLYTDSNHYCDFVVTKEH